MLIWKLATPFLCFLALHFLSIQASPVSSVYSPSVRVTPELLPSLLVQSCLLLLLLWSLLLSSSSSSSCFATFQALRYSGPSFHKLRPNGFCLSSPQLPPSVHTLLPPFTLSSSTSPHSLSPFSPTHTSGSLSQPDNHQITSCGLPDHPSKTDVPSCLWLQPGLCTGTYPTPSLPVSSQDAACTWHPVH